MPEVIEVPKSADEDLADKIVAALADAKLIAADRLPVVKSGLCDGTITSADWKLLVELNEPAASLGGAK